MPPLARPLHVAQVITGFDRGGAERVLLRTVQALDTARFRSSIVSLRAPGPLSRSAAKLGVSLTHLGMGRRPGPRAVWRLASVFRRQRIDIVHSYLYDAAIASRLAGWLAGVSVVLTSTRASLEYLPRYAWWLDRMTVPLCRRVIAVSRGTARFITEREGIPAAKVVVIRNGVDGTAFQPGDKRSAQTRMQIPPGMTVLACVGRLHVQKGHTYLLRALQIVRVERPGLLCLIAGEGPLRDQLAHEVRERGLADVCRLVGNVDDIACVYAAADVVVSSSLYEGMPNTILEAMAAGRAVVATAVQGSEELVHPGETGLLVPPGDSEALAAAVRQLVDNPELRGSMSARARQVALASYSVERMVREIETLYLTEWARASGS